MTRDARFLGVIIFSLLALATVPVTAQSVVGKGNNLMDDMRMGDQQPLEGFPGRVVPEMGHPK